MSTIELKPTPAPEFRQVSGSATKPYSNIFTQKFQTNQIISYHKRISTNINIAYCFCTPNTLNSFLFIPKPSILSVLQILWEIMMSNDMLVLFTILQNQPQDDK